MEAFELAKAIAAVVLVIAYFAFVILMHASEE